MVVTMKVVIPDCGADHVDRALMLGADPAHVMCRRMRSLRRV